MQVYDTVNKLAEEIKTSAEFIDLKNAKQAINIMPEYKNKIEEFNKLRYEEQLNAMQTGKTDETKMLNIQNMYKEMIEIPEIKKYFDAEFKFNGGKSLYYITQKGMEKIASGYTSNIDPRKGFSGISELNGISDNDMQGRSNNRFFFI